MSATIWNQRGQLQITFSAARQVEKHPPYPPHNVEIGTAHRRSPWGNRGQYPASLWCRIASTNTASRFGSYRYRAIYPASPNSITNSRNSGISGSGRPISGCLDKTSNCCLMAVAARRAASGFFSARNWRHRSRPRAAPGVTIIRGKAEPPFPVPSPKCQASHRPPCRSGATLSPGIPARLR